jgi:hypothetical protein
MTTPKPDGSVKAGGLEAPMPELKGKRAGSTDTNDFIPTATAGQPGFQTMKWTTVGNVSVTANNTTIVALP